MRRLLDFDVLLAGDYEKRASLASVPRYHTLISFTEEERYSATIPFSFHVVILHFTVFPGYFFIHRRVHDFSIISTYQLYSRLEAFLAQHFVV